MVDPYCAVRHIRLLRQFNWLRGTILNESPLRPRLLDWLIPNELILKPGVGFAVRVAG